MNFSPVVLTGSGTSGIFILIAYIAVFAVLIGAGFMLAGGNYDNKFLLNLLF